jgi:hypothetical protein
MISFSAVRNVILKAFGLVAVATLLVTPQAAADPGDETNSLNQFGVEMATDECNAAWIQLTIDGGPQEPDRYSVFYKGMEQNCTLRARFVGFAADKVTPVKTDYVTTNNRQEGAFAVPDVYRCHVEFGVQRVDGSFHTEFLRPEQPEVSNCPAV